MRVDETTLELGMDTLDRDMRERVCVAADRIVEAKKRGGKVVVITGSGPNLHEGVTTLIAELMRLDVVDGVTTSSAVVAHEMGGVLDRVKRVDGRALGLPEASRKMDLLPHGGCFELSLMDQGLEEQIRTFMELDDLLLQALRETPGKVIIKAAGNLGYPVGWYLERLALELLPVARQREWALERVLGEGADERTMIGIGARKGIPVLVTLPQLVGGGRVGLAIGDSLSISERSRRIAHMLSDADVIVESAVALTQEIHDGPFEIHTGHGLWAGWEGEEVYSLQGKTLIRIDLDPALETVWQAERSDSAVQGAIDKGLPKTKLFQVPFRMEMSGFARLKGSLPILGDIGAVWPALALNVCRKLGKELNFISYPQHTDQGQAMREWIVDTIKVMDPATTSHS